MAVIQIPNLPVATSLTGAELLEVVQAGVSCRTTSQDIADLAAPILSFSGYCGTFARSSTQTNSGATTANVVTFDVTPVSSGISLVAGTQITVANAGIYNVQYTVNAQKNDGGYDDIDVWIRQNGSNVYFSNAHATITDSGVAVTITRSVLVTLNTSGYVELVWSSADVDMTLTAAIPGTNPSRPAIPAAFVTMTLVQES